MIVNLRGTHGSGKSTVARWFLYCYPSQLITGLSPKGRLRVEGHRVNVTGWDKPLYLVGPYAQTCGGCDLVRPYDEIWRRVTDYAELGHVLFEGSLICSSVGSIGRGLAQRMDTVVAYLNTPLDVCIERIQERRALAGTVKPYNPKETVAKFNKNLRTRDQCRQNFKQLGVHCVDIDYKQASQQVFWLFKRGM